MKKPSYELQRIKVGSHGHDSTGAYWGAGPDVFIATSSDGNDQITVRAKSVTEAREKIAAERARSPTEKPANTDAIGGNPPRRTRYEIEWLDTLTNKAIKIRITHARDYLSGGTDHLEVESISPAKAPLPITETGYRSHFISPLELMNAGGPVSFVTAWIDREAKGNAWGKSATATQQDDLFSWAAAQADVVKRKAGKARKPPTDHEPRPSRRRAGNPAGPSKRSLDPA